MRRRAFVTLAAIGFLLAAAGPGPVHARTEISAPRVAAEDVIERSAISEFIQYGNGYDTAAYYQTFKDGRGNPLSGASSQGYVLTFPAGQLPEANRFWSVTAYTPDDIELVWNLAKKYVVASYAPGLQFNADGSLTIYLSADPPIGKPLANWLPVPRGPFNIMLRVYGPEGSVRDATYVPPSVQRPAAI